MARTKPRRADAHIVWLKTIYSAETWRPEGPFTGPGLGALTGADYQCLEAIDRLWSAYGYVDEPDGIIRAIAHTALQMQESTRVFAKEVIPHARDWGDREKLWPLVEMEMERIKLEAAEWSNSYSLGGR